ncbi:hypothetical protein RB620_18285 [Paenibacillus sp. LHD-117]|uniref:hypothetical protein n=1 Tax=Paenibacillus sp. LHD-117 TaxID=3071412 RepID=UPI0027E1BC41|nr:hypothetical protein [Paenibacillus sp. LHD-117]MDQ6421379.1 hypothetical protein [Paenibacillus sp. LHD-117]
MRKSSLWIYAGLVLVLAFDIWTNHSPEAKAFYDKLLDPIDAIKLSLIWSILFFIGLVIWYRDRLSLKEEEKDELKNQMRSRMEMLVMANQELSEYRMHDLLLGLFQRFVSIQPFVLGVQLYEYTIVNKSGYGTVKLNYFDGYVRELVDVNAAQQLYYSYPLDVMREYQDALESLYEEDNTEQIYPDKLINFCYKHQRTLSLKPNPAISEEDAIVYAFVSLGIDILSAALYNSVGSFIDPDKIKLILTKKRTGFLQSILANSPYTFSHHELNGKADRQYIGSPFHYNDRQYLYVIVLDQEILDESNYQEMITDITDGFESRLQKCLESVYNGNKKGDDEHGS